MSRLSRAMPLWMGVMGFAVFGHSVSAQPTGLEGHQVLRITTSSEAELDRLIAMDEGSTDFEIWTDGVGVGEVDVHVSPAQKRLVEETNLPFEVLIPDLQRHYDEIFGGERGGDFFERYRTYDEHLALMNDLAAAYPDLAEVVDLGPSVQGRRLWAIRITGPGEDKPAVMYHGGQHGNEIMGPAVIAYAAHHLLTNYEADPDVRAVVDGVEWFLLPIMNPDGYAAGRRYNANDVDLNRNWGGPGSRENPFSEPETAAMRDFFLSHPNTRAHLDMHSAGQMIMWPWGHTDEFSEDQWTFNQLGRHIRDLIVQSRESVYDRMGPIYRAIYPVSGGSLNYSYGELGIWGLTFELNQTQSPPAIEIIPTSQEILPTLTYLSTWVVDCNENQTPDHEDIERGESADCNSNGTPDECERPLDCNENGVLDVCDLNDGSSEDINANRIPDECECPRSGGHPLEFRLPGYADVFGWALSMDGEYLIIGDPRDEEQGEEAGGAHVFRRDGGGWVELVKLLAADGLPDDRFGESISVGGARVVIGASGQGRDGTGSGAAYVFRRDREDPSIWIQEAKLTPVPGRARDGFGLSVAIHEDVIVVGAPFDDDEDTNTGAVYVFRWDEGSQRWLQEAKLHSADGLELDGFGKAVVLDGDILVVGAPSDDNENGSNAGSAYVFRHFEGVWTQEQMLTADDGIVGRSFGVALDVSGDDLVIGACGHGPTGNASGSAYVFEYQSGSSEWVQKAKLIPLDSERRDMFGCSISLDGNLVAVGANQDNDNGLFSGSAYIFGRDQIGWREISKLLPSDGDQSDAFGYAIDIQEGTLIVGAHGRGSSGSAYVFSVADCNGDDTIDACQGLSAGDWDVNRTVDIDDYPGFGECLGGPEGLPSPGAPDCIESCLTVFDLNEDLDVDLGDFAEFSMLFN